MADDLEIPKKFSYLNFRRLSVRFQRTSSFLIFLTSSTTQMRLYRPCDFFGKLLILARPRKMHFTHCFVS